MLKIVNTQNAPAAIGPYSQAIIQAVLSLPPARFPLILPPVL